MPREDTQFTSENQPKKHGSRKGIPNTATIIKQILAQEVTDSNGNKVTHAYLMNKAIIDKAEAGDVPAFNSLSNRMDGMPKQSIDQTIRTPEPISIEFSLFEKKKKKDKTDK
ncbi:MAG: hypothetical protein U9O94_02210 [Nanoarchaeota archaeon]|nr:hypothetical protein [Nanoarchaeota archaeon]